MTGQGKDVETETGAIKAAKKALPVAKKALPVALFAIVVLAVGALLAASGVTGAGGRRAPVLASVAPAPGAPPVSAEAPNGRLLPAALVSRRPALTRASAPAHFLPDQYRQGQVLVGFRSGVSAAQRSAIARAVGAYGARQLGPTIKPAGRGRVRGQQFIAPFELRVPTSVPVLSIARRLRLSKAVAYAEPNYLESGDAAPNDESFPLQWGSSNTGQAIPTQSAEEVLGAPVNGTVGADDKALKAWKVTTGSPSIVIGEVDTGIALTHPDLAANIWSNPGNVFKAQKCAAGTHGFNVLSKNCNPEDEDETYNGHGTHVAGIMGGVGNNGIGVAGMNWQTTILPVKWMHNAAGGETSALIEALQFEVLAKQEGVNVRVVNDSDSFFGTTKSEALENEIEVLGRQQHPVRDLGGQHRKQQRRSRGAALPVQLRQAERDLCDGEQQQGRTPQLGQHWVTHGPAGGARCEHLLDVPWKHIRIPQWRLDGLAAGGGRRRADPFGRPLPHGRTTEERHPQKRR